MRALAIAASLLLAVAAPALAQRGNGNGNGNGNGGGQRNGKGGGHHGLKRLLDAPTIEAAKTLATSITSWARTDVLPEAQAWKTRLDNAMTPTDLAKLNDLRRQATSLRQRAAANMKAMHEAWKSEDYAALKSAREAKKGFKQEYKAIVEQLKPIAEANRGTLESIGEDARPKIKEWIDGARSIGEAWYEQHKTTISPMAAHAIASLMQHKQHLGALIEPKLRTKAAAARFMLWDGSDITKDLDEMIDRSSVESIQELDLD